LLNVKDITFRKSFDNVIVCGPENNFLLEDLAHDKFLFLAKDNGAAILTPIEVDSLLSTLFSKGSLDSNWIGRSAHNVCDFMGVYRDYPIKLVLAPVQDGIGGSALLKEKLVPILSVSRMHEDEDALGLAKSILDHEGTGHIEIVHCNDKSRIEAFYQVVNVSRILVNTPGTVGCIRG
jgi:acetaldehyde dehydrogenase/alcohol dehydrogenase